jgi:hypothetical protein
MAAQVHYLQSSATNVAHFYRGYVIEPTPMGRWVLYREGPEASEPNDASTVDQAVMLIDRMLDGVWPARADDPDAIRWQDLGAALAVSAGIVAVVLWLAVAT